MPKVINRLAPRALARLPDGYHADGRNLYLRVRGVSRSWVLRYRFNGKINELTLGPLDVLALADAREKRDELLRVLKLEKRDPAETLRVKRHVALTFAECAARLIEAKRAEWTNAKHVQQWENTLAQFAFPIIGHLRPAEVETRHVLAILEPIWTTKTETASRLQQRIAAVLDWAAAHGLRGGENPARWKGHLDKLLPAPSKVVEGENMPALDYAEAADFWRVLDAKTSMAARALALLILTAVRPLNVRFAQWQEFDFEARVWRIPGASDYGQRMKTKRPHAVPLTAAALDLLHGLPRFTDCPWVFPSRGGKPLSDMALTKLLRDLHEARRAADGIGWIDRRQGGRVIVAHGFRATFRTWGENETHYPRALLEDALAHDYKGEVEAVYARGDLVEKRRPLMEQWARFVTTGANDDGR
jgi:integrase